MSRFALIMATFLVVSAVVPALAPIAEAQAVPTPTLTVVVFGETNNSRQVFSPDRLLVPQVPIHLIVTFHNNDTIQHTFTMNDENGTKRIDTGFVNSGRNVTVNFTVVSMTRVTYNGTSFTPEAGPNGILFYCIPHRGTGIVGQGMVGQIILASVQQGAVQEKGILLRAYWIGIIGIASMLVWVVISYYVIKSSSRHFTDQKEHVRKGLP